MTNAVKYDIIIYGGKGYKNHLKVAFFIVSLVFIVLDILTGWTKALATGTTNSSIMRVGLYHKLGEVLAIGFGYVCELSFPYVGISISVPLVESIATYIILMEVASIVENITKINPHLSEILGKIFKKENSDEK